MEALIGRALDSGQSPAYFRHLAAAFFYYQGDERKATTLWKSVRGDQAVGYLAEQNLADLKLPSEEREGPFIFRLMELLPLSCRFELPESEGPAPLLMELTLERMLAALRCKAASLLKGVGRVLRAMVKTMASGNFSCVW